MVFLAILLGFLPGFAWLFFYMQEDPHREPNWLVLKTFVYGMVGAIFALIMENIFNKLFPDQSSTPFVFIFSLAVLALIEEFFKFASAQRAVRNSPAFEQPIDAMIYVMIASLGFATLENLGVLTTPFTQVTQTATISGIFETVSFRFIGATLLHALTGSVIGYHWALAIREFGRWRILVRGIIFATVLHLVFNYLILSFDTYVLPVLFLLIVGFFVLTDFEKLKNKSI